MLVEFPLQNRNNPWSSSTEQRENGFALSGPNFHFLGTDKLNTADAKSTPSYSDDLHFLVIGSELKRYS